VSIFRNAWSKKVVFISLPSSIASDIESFQQFINTKTKKNMAEIIQLPESGGAGVGNIPFSIPLGGNGGGMFGGNGQTNLMDLLGFAIVASIFPNFFGGNGYGGRGQCNCINSDLATQAVIAQGEASRTAIQTLASSVGQDFNIVYGAVQNAQGLISQLATANGMGFLQTVNAIQAGDANIIAQFQNCCCENRLAICQQTNALQNSIADVNQNISATRSAQQLADCQQTYALTDTMNRNFLALDNKLDAMESNRKDREITALTAEVATLKSQNFTAGVIQQAVAPLNAQLAGIRGEVDAIKGKMPNTISVEYPQVAVVNTTPYMGGYYPGGFGYGGF